MDLDEHKLWLSLAVAIPHALAGWVAGLELGGNAWQCAILMSIIGIGGFLGCYNSIGGSSG